MDTVARMPAADRAELFRNTAARMDLESALVEKDFWVCWTLGHLFDMETTNRARHAHVQGRDGAVEGVQAH